MDKWASVSNKKDSVCVCVYIYFFEPLGQISTTNRTMEVKIETLSTNAWIRIFHFRLCRHFNQSAPKVWVHSYFFLYFRTNMTFKLATYDRLQSTQKLPKDPDFLDSQTHSYLGFKREMKYPYRTQQQSWDLFFYGRYGVTNTGLKAESTLNGLPCHRTVPWTQWFTPRGNFVFKKWEKTRKTQRSALPLHHY